MLANQQEARRNAVKIFPASCWFVQIPWVKNTVKYINLVILVLMLLFMGVQYNDPDGPMWVVIYGVPAIWAGLAFFRLPLFRLLESRKLMLVSVLAALAGMVYFWPTTPHWWASEVWWETETAREGMGMMIANAALLITWVIGRKV